ncbi:g1168 [Coccomyxa elongata]
MFGFITAPRLVEVSLPDGITVFQCPFLECGFSTPILHEISQHCRGIHVTDLRYSPESQAGRTQPVCVLFGVTVPMTGQPVEALLSAVQSELRSPAPTAPLVEVTDLGVGCPYGCQLDVTDDLLIFLHLMDVHGGETVSPLPTPPNPSFLLP